MRAFAFTLLCLISMAGMALSPPLYAPAQATHQPTDPVAHGIQIELTWRKADRCELDRDMSDELGGVYAPFPVRSDSCRQSRIAGRERDLVRGRELDHVRLARAPPIE